MSLEGSYIPLKPLNERREGKIAPWGRIWSFWVFGSLKGTATLNLKSRILRFNFAARPQNLTAECHFLRKTTSSWLSGVIRRSWILRPGRRFETAEFWQRVHLSFGGSIRGQAAELKPSNLGHPDLIPSAVDLWPPFWPPFLEQLPGWNLRFHSAARPQIWNRRFQTESSLFISQLHTHKIYQTQGNPPNLC